MMKPALTRGDMGNLIAMDNLQYIGALGVFGGPQFLDHHGRDIQTARLEYKWYNCQSRTEIVRRVVRRFPQSIMGGKIAVSRVEFLKACGEETEMSRFVRSDPYPVFCESFG